MCGVLLQFQNNTPWSIFSLSGDGSNGAVVPQDDTRLTEGQYVVLSSSASQFLKCLFHYFVLCYANQWSRWRNYRCYSNGKGPQAARYLKVGQLRPVELYGKLLL